MSKRTFITSGTAEITRLSVWYISTRGEKERMCCVGDVCGRVQRTHRGLSRADTGQLHWLANKQHKAAASTPVTNIITRHFSILVTITAMWSVYQSLVHSPYWFVLLKSLMENKKKTSETFLIPTLGKCHSSKNITTGFVARGLLHHRAPLLHQPSHFTLPNHSH